MSLKRGELALLQLRLSPGRPNAVLIRPEGAEEVLPLPPGFRFDAFHLHYPISPNRFGRFDEITVRFHLGGTRDSQSARMAIDRFTLRPR